MQEGHSNSSARLIVSPDSDERLADLLAHMGFRAVQQMIERTLGRIKHQMLPIPRLIRPAHDFILAWKVETIDIG